MLFRSAAADRHNVWQDAERSGDCGIPAGTDSDNCLRNREAPGCFESEFRSVVRNCKTSGRSDSGSVSEPGAIIRNREVSDYSESGNLIKTSGTDGGLSEWHQIPEPVLP